MHIILFICYLNIFITFIGSEPTCDEILPKELKQEIQSYQAIVDRIIKEVLSGGYQNKTYDELALFTDTFGSRIAGSDNLENAIDYTLKKLQNIGLENVHGEKVDVPHWVRGFESAELIQPRHQKLNMLSLGYSVGTPPEGITAEVVVFRSFEEMYVNAAYAKNKIVVFNEKYTTYGETVEYRSKSASYAAHYGALAVLIASVTPFSLDTPHTGMQSYMDNVTQIPAACITHADAHMLARMQKRKTKLVIKLIMSAQNLPNRVSRNVIADITGNQYPSNVVIVSGHIDSWDVGQGAMDDGGGAFISWNALGLLKKLGLRARRTIRSILWTSEEFGLIGAAAYFKSFDIKSINLIMESDLGTFKPLGFDFAGNLKSSCIAQEILKLFKSIDLTYFKKSSSNSVGSDIELWTRVGVPGISLKTLDEKYFWLHHTNADTMDVENPNELDLCTAVFAATSYVAADLSINFPQQINNTLVDIMRQKQKTPL